MKTTPIQVKVAGFFFALLTSVAVLGATVAGMLSGGPSGGETATLNRMAVSVPAPTAVN